MVGIRRKHSRRKIKIKGAKLKAGKKKETRMGKVRKKISMTDSMILTTISLMTGIWKTRMVLALMASEDQVGSTSSMKTSMETLMLR